MDVGPFTCFRRHHLRSVFVFSVVSWAYKVCMFYLLLINVDISLFFRRLYSRNSFIFKLIICVIFLGKRCVTCDNCRLIPVKPALWSINALRYLYSFWVLFVFHWVKLNNNMVYFILGFYFFLGDTSLFWILLNLKWHKVLCNTLYVWMYVCMQYWSES